jgi:hypothetical protein
VDLEVGQSTTFETRDGESHAVKLLSQSLDEVRVSVDGVTALFDLNENQCGSPGRRLPREVSGVLVLPEVISDIQQAAACDELNKHRRWTRLKVSWETGDIDADKDVEEPGFARLLLADPALSLPTIRFPLQTSGCATLLDKAGVNLRPCSYGFHAGLDFGVPVGTPVLAPQAGTITVIKRGCNVANPDCGLCGNTIWLESEEFSYFFCHFDKISASLEEGQEVAMGDYLGDVGTTGANGNGSYSPHLHFAVYLLGGIPPINEDFSVNPFPYLDADCKGLVCGRR